MRAASHGTSHMYEVFVHACATPCSASHPSGPRSALVGLVFTLHVDGVSSSCNDWCAARQKLTMVAADCVSWWALIRPRPGAQAQAPSLPGRTGLPSSLSLAGCWLMTAPWTTGHCASNTSCLTSLVVLFSAAHTTTARAHCGKRLASPWCHRVGSPQARSLRLAF